MKISKRIISAILVAALVLSESAVTYAAVSKKAEEIIDEETDITEDTKLIINDTTRITVTVPAADEKTASSAPVSVNVKALASAVSQASGSLKNVVLPVASQPGSVYKGYTITYVDKNGRVKTKVLKKINAKTLASLTQYGEISLTPKFKVNKYKVKLDRTAKTVIGSDGKKVKIPTTVTNTLTKLTYDSQVNLANLTSVYEAAGVTVKSYLIDGRTYGPEDIIKEADIVALTSKSAIIPQFE